jgi:hypothetical protein
MTRYQAAAIGLDPARPFLTVNEVRRLEELATVDGGDVLASQPSMTQSR